MPPDPPTDGLASQPAARPLPLQFDDVFLVTDGGTDEVAVPGLALSIDDSGICLLKPDGSPAAAMAWEVITGVDSAGRTAPTEGTSALVLEVATAARTHRFVVPTEAPDAADHAIQQAWASQSGPSSPARRSPAMVGSLLVLAAVVVAVAVLYGLGVL